MYLLLALVLAYFVDPVITWMEYKRVPRWLGTLIVYLATIGLLADRHLRAHADQGRQPVPGPAQPRTGLCCRPSWTCRASGRCMNWWKTSTARFPR